MKTKIVNLHFELIVEVEDNAGQPEIMEAASVMIQDMHYDGQTEARELTKNNLVSIADYKEGEDGKWFTAILAKNQIARIVRDGSFPMSATMLACLQDIEKITGEGNQPSVQSITESKYV